MAQTFEARYRGRCASAACDRPIEQGDQVVFVDQAERSVSGACSC